MANKTTELTEQSAADVVDGDWLLFVDLTGPTSEKLSVASLRSALARLGLNPPTTGILAINGTAQANWDDGAFFPETTNDVDLGKTAKLFKSGYLVNLDLGASGVAGTLDVFPTTASKGKLAVSVTDQTGDTTVSLVIGAMAGARTVTLRDPGAAASILTTTDATAAATAATAAEITRACDVSARMVTLAGSTSISEATHEGKTCLLTGTGSAFTQTLPAATGSGARYRFVVGAVNTSNHIITVTGDDTFKGMIFTASTGDTPDLGQPWVTAANSDTITLNGTDQGGQAVGDWIECEDVAADVWALRGMVTASGTEVTPISGS